MNQEFNTRVHVGQLLDGFSDRLKCSLCHELMEDPIQTMRGQSSCRTCYIHTIKDDGKYHIDNELNDDARMFFKDRAKLKEILNLACTCINKQDGCPWSGNVKGVKEHILICEYTKMLCQYCKVMICKSEQTSHLAQCGGNQTVDCTYSLSGCPFKAQTHAEMVEHMEKSNNDHLRLQSTLVSKLEQENKQFKIQMENSNHKQQQYVIEITSMKSELTSMKNTMQHLLSELHNLKNRVEEGFKSLPQRKCQQEEEKAVVSKDKTNKNDAVQHSNEIANIVTKTINDISELDLRLQLHENTTYNGKLVWKIDKFSCRRQQALTGKVTALHSAPCFVSRYGYKFCARLYLNGDGAGRGTHLSLFIVIMRSEYDNLIEWPFQKQVKMTLVNQRNQKLNVVDKMMPNIDSSSFQKPKKEMNIASGSQLFVEIDRLEKDGFMMNDSIFLEIEVT